MCALALGALGSPKNPVERPNKLQGQFTIALNLITGTWVYEGFGVNTHAGRFTSHATGYLDAAGNLVGGGTAVGANGDQIFWSAPGSIWHVEYAGGTGRFEHVTGGWEFVTETLTETRVNPDGTMSMTYAYTGEGTVTY
ncbi:MAG: hypothetical protein M5U12_33565 [Verrucomicrobia bacterium]|nr:hypothetical protein [Verrucomicrobiota bacterium]